MAENDYREYIKYYKLEEPEDYNEVFGQMDEDKIVVKFHSIAYVINSFYEYDTEDGLYKYISCKIRLKYNDAEFVEYEVIYGLDGKFQDDYFRLI